MIVYYLISIALALGSFFNKRWMYWLFILLGCVFLIIAPSTNFDYEAYKNAYDNAYVMDGYPWFTSQTYLDAEPLFMAYIAFWKVSTGFPFSYFLAINFTLCVALSAFFLRKTFAEVKYDWWLMFMPVIFPTLFYWSPRSSISFVFLFGSFILFCKKKYIGALPLLIFSFLMHSQFLLFASLLLLSAIVMHRKGGVRIGGYGLWWMISSVALFIALRYMPIFADRIASWLSFLPSATIISSKMGYFEGLEETFSGFRLTALLSTFLYPMLCFYLLQRKKVLGGELNLLFSDETQDRYFVNLLFSIVLYGAVINLAFWGNPHVAGRLSRFSDYVGMGLLIPLFMHTYFQNRLFLSILLVFFCILTPFLYPTLYTNVDWSILL